MKEKNVMDIVGKRTSPRISHLEKGETDGTDEVRPMCPSGLSVPLIARNTKLRGVAIIWSFSTKNNQR